MRDLLLALCVGLMFVLGYFPMRRLDRFLEKNRATAERRGEAALASTGDGRRARGARTALPGGWRGENWPPLRHS